MRASLTRAVVAQILLIVLLAACDPEASTVPGPRESVRSEPSLRVQVLQWECGHEIARTAEEAIEAEGEFCLVEMDLANRGSQALTLDPGCQLLLDEGGDRFLPDPEVLALDELALKGFGQPIPPGVTVRDSALYFDVPVGTAPRSIELHETCGGPGLQVPLEREGAEESLRALSPLERVHSVD